MSLTVSLGPQQGLTFFYMSSCLGPCRPIFILCMILVLHSLTFWVKVCLFQLFAVTHPPSPFEGCCFISVLQMCLPGVQLPGAFFMAHNFYHMGVAPDFHCLSSALWQTHLFHSLLFTRPLFTGTKICDYPTLKPIMLWGSTNIGACHGLAHCTSVLLGEPAGLAVCHLLCHLALSRASHSSTCLHA